MHKMFLQRFKEFASLTLFQKTIMDKELDIPMYKIINIVSFESEKNKQ